MPFLDDFYLEKYCPGTYIVTDRSVPGAKCLLLQCSIHAHGPRQKPAAAGRLLSWQQGWRKWSGRLQAQAGGQVVRRQQQGCLAAKAEAQLKRRASTPCSEARVVADEGNPLEALSCSVIHHAGKRQPFHTCMNYSIVSNLWKGRKISCSESAVIKQVSLFFLSLSITLFFTLLRFSFLLFFFLPSMLE